MAVAENDYIIDGCMVRPEYRLIERGADSVRIKPKAMAVLECLVRAEGAVVAKDELFEKVWPGGVVSEETLTQCISELRRAFGDTARESRVIQTIPKQGFRLRGSVEPRAIPPAGGSATLPGPAAIHSLGWGALAIVLIATIATAWYRLTDPEPAPRAEQPSVAVLPFVDMSPDATQGWFADGLSEELITRLSRLEGLLVASRTSSFQFRDASADLREVGSQLGVSHVLEGSVRKADGQLRITAQLIDVGDGFHLWAETYDRPFEDIFAVQDEIAGNVASALSIALSVGEIGGIEGGTTNVAAFEELLRANALHKQSDADSVLAAIDRYERAVEIDPEFAIAWAELSKAHRNVRLLLGEAEGERHRPRIDSAMNEALRLAPDSPYVLEMAALNHMDRREWLQAERLLRRAGDVLGDTAGAGGLRVEMLLLTGQAGEAVRRLERALRREPLGAGISHYLGHAYATNGRIEEALAELERGYGLECCRAYTVIEGLLAALASGDEATISLWLDRAVEHEPPGAYGAVAGFAARIGDRDDALDWLRAGFDDRSVPDFYTIVFASFLGDTSLALEALQRFPDAWTFWLPLTAPLRADPAFESLMSDIGLVEYWEEFGWNDFCRPTGGGEFACE